MSEDLRKYFKDAFGIEYIRDIDMDNTFYSGEYGYYMTTDSNEKQLYHFSNLEIFKAEQRMKPHEIS